MIDRISLDQLRAFIAAAEEGSFSAAGRKLRRAQSVVSQTLAALEAELGVQLFDRSARYPVLTEAGRALLADARTVAAAMDRLRAQAKELAGGLEAELSIAVDVMFPGNVLTAAVTAFHGKFPSTPLRLEVEALGAVVKPVLEGRCAFAIMGSLPAVQAQTERERLLAIRMVTVAAPGHPLAALRGTIARTALSEHVQLVLSDRSELTKGREFGVMSSRTWRLADLGAKHAFLRAGLGFGGMPLGLVADDLAAGTLVKLAIEDVPREGLVMPMSAIWRSDSPPGPAGRWLIARLKETRPGRAS